MRRFSLASLGGGGTNTGAAGVSGSPAHGASGVGGGAPQPLDGKLTSLSMNIDLSFMKTMGNIATGGTSKAAAAAASEQSKHRNEELDKRAQLNKVIALLDNVRLQCPAAHSGLVVAYSSVSMSPLINPGLKFTWYRLGNGQEQFYQVDESTKAWYSPTFDDIGCKICAQCEDNFDQGFSRYIECGPIAADPSLCTLAEAALEHSYCEVKDVAVSMGLQERGLNDHDLHHHSNQSLTDPSSSMNTTDSMHSDAGSAHHVNHYHQPTAQDRATALSTREHFLQLDGRSAVTVDAQGVFISIPVHNNTTSGVTFRASSRGMRIPPSPDLTVQCTQPASLVLTVPVRDLQSSSSTSSSASAHQSSSSNPGTPQRNSLSEKSSSTMNSFLSSATLTIPWTYEGIHSPEAIAGDALAHSTEGGDSELQREQIMRFAEQDAIDFANVVCLLAEYVASLPEDTKVLKICISCGDRMQRDLLVSAIRSLSCQPPGATTEERMTVFPWITVSDETGEQVHSQSLVAKDHDISSNIKDMQLKMRDLEEENVALKRERNELTMQIMQQRELHAVSAMQGTSSHARVMLNTMAAVADSLGAHSNALLAADNDDNSGSSSAAHQAVDGNSDGVDDTETHPVTSDSINSNNSLSEAGAAEAIDAYRKLSANVIDLENKLKVAAKKESESGKLRNELENRNKVIQAESDKYKKLFEDIRIQHALLKHEKELLEAKVQQQTTKLDDFHTRLEAAMLAQTELEELKPILVVRELDLQSLKGSYADVTGQLEDLKKTSIEIETTLTKKVKVLTAQLNAMEADKVAKELKIEELEELTAHQAKSITSTAQLQDSLREAESENARLHAELNHSKKKADSQGRDLQKAIKDSAMMLGEYEIALKRKSDEASALQRELDYMMGVLHDPNEDDGNVSSLTLGGARVPMPRFSLPPIPQMSNINLDPLGILHNKDSASSGTVQPSAANGSESGISGPSSLLQSFLLMNLRANQQGQYTPDSFSPPPIPRPASASSGISEMGGHYDEVTNRSSSPVTISHPTASVAATESTQSHDDSDSSDGGASSGGDDEETTHNRSVTQTIAISDSDLHNKQFTEELLVENAHALSMVTVVKTQRHLSREFIEQYVSPVVSRDVIHQYQPQYFRKAKGDSIGTSSAGITTTQADHDSKDTSSNAPSGLDAAKASLASFSATIDQSSAKTVQNVKGLFRRLSMNRPQPVSEDGEDHTNGAQQSTSTTAPPSNSTSYKIPGGLASPPVVGRYSNS